MIEKRITVAEGVSLNVAVGPSNGSLLLLLTGFSRSWRSFEPVLSALTPHWQVFGLDYRGHGLSSRVPGEYRLMDYLNDLRAMIGTHFTDPLVILGNSLGGWLAMHAAIEFPDRVRGIIVGDMGLDLEVVEAAMQSEPSREFSRSRQELAGRPVDEILPILAARDTPPEEALELSQLDPAVYDLHVVGDTASYTAGIPPLRLERIACPALFIQGNPDLGAMISDADVSRALASVAKAAHVRIDHAGHDLGFWKGNVTPYITAVTGFLATL